MSITIEINERTFAPWEEGADERELMHEWTSERTFANARECADWLEREGFGAPSVHPGPYDENTWLDELDPYEHPYSGTLTERTAHVYAGFSPRLWAAIVHAVSRPYTRYEGPYYRSRAH